MSLSYLENKNRGFSTFKDRYSVELDFFAPLSRACFRNHKIRRLWVAFLLLCVFQLLIANTALAQRDRIGRIRAALVYYVVKFVEFKDRSPNPIKLCVVGEDPLNDYIQETVAGKMAHGEQLEVKFIPSTAIGVNLDECDVAYFGELEAKSVDRYIYESQAIMTICAVNEVQWGNCLIQVFEENNKPRIAVDLKSPVSHKFSISSELLDVSEVNK